MRLLVIALLFILWSCGSDSNSSFSVDTPKHFPSIQFPAADYSLEGPVRLGEMLFFDRILSRDTSISCSSCHLPEKAFSGGSRTSIGVDGRAGFRNAPTLINVVYSSSFFHDGGVPSLERQVLAPFDNHDEFDLPISEAIARLKSHPFYGKEFQEVFGAPPSVFTLTRAIADFERTIVVATTAWDAFIQGDSTALSPEQQKGWLVFQEVGCAKCHVPPLFSDFSFQNNGLFKEYDNDPGRARVTLLPEDVGLFKVPILRNLALTGPYAHNGAIVHLDSVIASYSRGGSGHANQSNLVKPIPFSEEDKHALKLFLMEGLLDSSL